MPACNSKVRSQRLCERSSSEAEMGTEHSRRDIAKVSPETSPCSQAPCQAGCHLSQVLSSTSSSTCHHAASRYHCFQLGLVFPFTPSRYPCSFQRLVPASPSPAGTAGVLTGLPGDELRYGGGERGAGIRGAHQLVLGHLGVGLGELQPQRLGDLGVEADALWEGRRDRRRRSGWASTAACRPRSKNNSPLFMGFFNFQP